MKYLLFTLASLLISITTLAQTGKIYGTVTDQYGNPVEGIAVQIKSIQRGVTTNNKGVYELKNLPFGSYTLEITSIQFIIN